MKSFITGSRAYGTATPESDLDLCVLMDQATLATLDNAFGFPIKCGKLNIIPCTSELEMLAWKRATDQCIAVYKRERKLGKAQAVAIHEAIRKEFGIAERDLGGSGGTPEEQEEIAFAKQEARELVADGYFDRNGNIDD